MKKLIKLALVLVLSQSTFAQDIPQLKLTPKGVEAIVVDVDSLTASKTYQKALNWVQETYKNPDEVLKANITNEKIRFNGYATSAWYTKSLGITQSFNMEYSVEVSFKDGKYRFEYIIGQFWVNGGGKAFYTYTTFYKKDGTIRKAYEPSVPALEQTMNDLHQSFYNYVTGKTSKKDNDW